MSSSPVEVARAFSAHRFAQAYEYLAADVRWVLHGGPVLLGRQAAIDACQQTEEGLAETTTRFLELRTIDGGDTVVIDAVAEYVPNDGSGASRVASCDIYDFVDGAVVTITSYTIELDPGDPSAEGD